MPRRKKQKEVLFDELKPEPFKPWQVNRPETEAALRPSYGTGTRAGAVASSLTSQAAGERINMRLGKLQSQVLEVIRRRGRTGMTDEEIEQSLSLRHQSASARRRELVLRKLVQDSGRTTLTTSGSRAVLWVAI